MGFIKYSVVELGIEEDVPGWIKQADETVAAKTEQVAVADEAPANIKSEEQKEDTAKE